METGPVDTKLEIKPWRRLWVKLAIFGAFGVVVTHSVHLVVSNHTTSAALTARLVNQGQILAQLVGKQAVDAVLTDDRVVLQELVDMVSASRDVAYCFIHKDSMVVASSFRTGTPAGLVQMKHPTSPLVVRSGGQRYLSLARPILGGSAGHVHVGLHLDVLATERQKLAVTLGLIALLVVLGGVLSAFVVGRRIARPVGEMVSVLQNVDPSEEPTSLPERSRDEIGLLTRMFNAMRARLHRAYLAQERARREQMQTEKLAALGTLVAGVAHEVNNPLAGLKNCQRRLCKRDLPDERRAEYLELMEDGLNRIEDVVKQLLRFSRGSPLQRTPVCPSRLIASSVKLLQPVLASGSVRLEVDTSATSSQEVMVDAGQVEQALVNLLLNAVYVTPNDGLIRVRTTVLDGMAGIEVHDQGPGIPDDILDKVEDPFFSTKPEGKGTGLGLPVTRGIVDAHHGDLRFAFPQEGGTKVTLFFPLQHPA